jgi:hypothetical protein
MFVFALKLTRSLAAGLGFTLAVSSIGLAQDCLKADLALRGRIFDGHLPTRRWRTVETFTLPAAAAFA